MITIDEIANNTRQRGGHYFDENTLEFFGQILSDFKILDTNGRIFVYALCTTSPIPFYSVGEYWNNRCDSVSSMPRSDKNGTETELIDAIIEYALTPSVYNV